MLTNPWNARNCWKCNNLLVQEYRPSYFTWKQKIKRWQEINKGNPWVVYHQRYPEFNTARCFVGFKDGKMIWKEGPFHEIYQLAEKLKPKFLIR